MLVSASAHLAGIVEARPPQTVVWAAQAVLGGGIGCRFVGVAVSQIVDVAKAASGSCLISLSMAAIAATLIHPVAKVTWPVLLLAYSPGGITEMTLLALALGQDAAFVATHHALRVILLCTMTPLLFKAVNPNQQ